MKLRPYQTECVDAICAQLRDNRSTVAVLATGLGKTICFAETIRRSLAMPGRRAIVLAHREELIMQAMDKIEAVTGIECAIEMADLRSMEDGLQKARVVVSSIQTQNAGRADNKRMTRFRIDSPWFVVVDECHHAPSASYKAVINHYMQHPQSKLLGVTATPDRLDNLALGQVFESVAYSYDVSDGIRDGWLVPVHQRFVQCDDLDLSEVATSGGDLKLCDLERELEKSLQSMVLPLVEIAGTRRALIFAATVKHAERICEIINRSGLNTGAAAIVHGNTPREVRKDIFSSFGEGKYQYLVNVAVATEGWDDPALDGKGVQIIGMMCPTKSRARYSQMLGRGTRTLPGTVDGIEDAQGRKDAIAASAKSRMLVLDFLGNSGRHTLIHAGDVLGGKMDEKVMARYRRESEKKGVPEEIDVLAELSHADREHRKALEARTRERIIGRAKYSSQEVDPFERLGIVPVNTPWWMKRIPATVKQRAMLERSGLALPKDIDTGRASQLIEHIMSRPSDKQAFVLRRAGVDPTGMSRRQASEAIDKVMNS